MEQILPIAGGAAGVVGLYLAYLAATKGAPAAWTALASWWTAGKTELATIKADVASAHAKIAALQTNVTGLVAPVAALQTDVTALKAKVGA